MSDRLTAVQGKLDSLYAQMETAKAELGKPFPQEEELRTKSARLAELNIELNIDDKTPLEALAEEAPPRAAIAKSAKPSVLQKLSDMKGMDHAMRSCAILRNEKSAKKKSTVVNDRAQFSVGTMRSHR